MTASLAGKVILVTGASRGIGRAVAQACLDAGAERVIGTATSPESWQREASALCGEPRFVPVECRFEENGAPETLVEQVRRMTSRLDGLIQNAAILGVRSSLESYDPELFDRVMRVNVAAVFRSTRRLIPLMRTAGGGSIVMVSSSVGRIGKAQTGAYSVSKFALEGMMEILAAELAPDGIRVNAYNPQPTRTDMRAAFRPDEDPRSIPPPERHGPPIVWMMSDQSRSISGRTLDPQSETFFSAT